jgi:hypothetical protein
MKFIKNTFTEHTGGGFWVDFVTLSDNRVIGINEECIVVYPSFEAFNNQNGFTLPNLEFNPLLPAIKETRKLVKEDRVISNQIFENFDDVIQIPEGFISTSWRNNACPSMALEIDENTSITIWIDYKNPELRQTGGKRFIVSIQDEEEEFNNSGEFDTLEEALERVNFLKTDFAANRKFKKIAQNLSTNTYQN